MVPAGMASKRSATKVFSPQPLLKRLAVGSDVSWQRSPAASLAQIGPVFNPSSVEALVNGQQQEPLLHADGLLMQG